MSVETTSEEVTLTPQKAIDLLCMSHRAGIKRSIILTGSPGIGKTALARQAAAELGVSFVAIHPTMPADEVAGIPDLVAVNGGAKRTDYALPIWYPTATEHPNWQGIILLDDALQGTGEMQKNLANLIQERELRGHKLPDGAMIVATGNRIQDKAGVTRTLTHFADRMCWVNVKSEASSWITNFAIPNELEQEVIGYIMLDNTKLDMFDPNKPKCPTPRTWEAVSKWTRLLKNNTTPQNQDIMNKYSLSLFSGELGLSEATRYQAFCNVFSKLPDIDNILKNPKTHKIDYELDIQYALIVAIAQHMDETTFEAALEYIDRIGPDLTLVAVILGSKKNPKLKTSAPFVQWSVKNQELIHGVLR